MPERSPIDRLDEALQALLSGQAGAAVGPEERPLLAIAAALVDLPRPGFKARLKADVERMRNMTSIAETTPALGQTATARMRVRDAAAAIEFYKKAFDARELMRFVAHGQIAHAELAIGNSVVMLGEEAPDWGYPGPESLGGSPIGMHLYVDDADSLVERAVAAGARLISPVKDQFYGDRSGQVADPFGYGWTIATRKQQMSVEEMQRQFAALEAEQQSSRTAATYRPEGFHTVTPYLVVENAPGLIEFTRQAFGAEERYRSIGSAGGVHAEVRIGDSMLMIGGGAPELSWRGEVRPTALHIYVEDADSVFERALQAGATATQRPVDQPYGDREAGVKDAFGNHWYIATSKGAHHIPEGLHTVTPYLHPLRAEPMIAFLKRAFVADAVEKYATPDGVIHHAKVRITDSVIEMGEAHGPHQPMPSMFYLYVPDVDATYNRALAAGATSIAQPADQPYGDRSGGVADPFGNQWYIGTQIREVRSR